MNRLPMFASALVALAFIPMVLEAARSAANERALRAAGAVEPPDDVYPAMQIVYPMCFIGMVAEAWWRGSGVNATALAGALVFASAKALKYWVISTLGERWTFRVLVPPGSRMTRRGPYRWMRHPNYLAVVGELAGFAMLAQSPVAGSLAVVTFGLLLRARIRVEERALGLPR
jgi:methyltransferase